MKFTGHERDLSAGPTTEADDLDYMHQRHYNMQLGRFLQPDPILGNPQAPQSWNRYALVLGNPMKYLDHYGLFEELPTSSGEITVSVTGDPPGLNPLPPSSPPGGGPGASPPTPGPTPPPAPKNAPLSAASSYYLNLLPKCDDLVEARFPVPPGVSTFENMETARRHGPEFGWFKSMVDYGQPWDYKSLDPMLPELQNFGNFHYGAVGSAAGFPSAILKGAAGFAHWRAGSKPSHWWSWFDDSRDTGFIEEGIEFKSLYESGECIP